MAANPNAVVESVASAIRPYIEPRVIDGSKVKFNVRMDGADVSVTVYADIEAFQIKVHNVAVLWKIEDQTLDSEVASEIVGNFMSLLKDGNISVDRHELLGRVAYSVHSTDPNFQKVPQYQSVGDWVLSKITRARPVGSLTLA